MDDLGKKINDFINLQVNYVEKEGKTKFSTCNHSNWDNDIWAYKDIIIKKLKDRGYSVTQSVSYGVTDVIVTLSDI